MRIAVGVNPAAVHRSHVETPAEQNRAAAARRSNPGGIGRRRRFRRFVGASVVRGSADMGHPLLCVGGWELGRGRQVESGSVGVFQQLEEPSQEPTVAVDAAQLIRRGNANGSVVG